MIRFSVQRLAYSLTLMSASALAHPVAFKDSFALILNSNSDMVDALAYYSLNHRLSIGLQSFYSPNESGKLSDVALYPRVGLLVKRWNFPSSQANIYFSGGYGARKQTSSWKGSSFLEGDIDWEDRRLYTAAKVKVLDLGKNNSEDVYTYRAGFAPYLAESNELNTWFIVQFDYARKSDEHVIFTPLMRMFYQNILFELGYSSRASVQFNFMTHL